MLVELSKLEVREIIRCVAGSDIDGDLLRKIATLLESAPAAQRYETTVVRADDLLRVVDRAVAPVPDNDRPPRVPLIEWTPELAAIYKVKLGWDLTKAEADEINAVRQKASDDEWHAARNYRPQLNQEGYGVVTAAFVEPDRPRAPGYVEAFSIGSKNAGGDECVRAGSYTGAVFVCGNGHGYSLNGTTSGCPQCWLNGSAAPAAQREDPDKIEGEESF